MSGYETAQEKLARTLLGVDLSVKNKQNGLYAILAQGKKKDDADDNERKKKNLSPKKKNKAKNKHEEPKMAKTRRKRPRPVRFPKIETEAKQAETTSRTMDPLMREGEGEVNDTDSPLLFYRKMKVQNNQFIPMGLIASRNQGPPMVVIPPPKPTKAILDKQKQIMRPFLKELKSLQVKNGESMIKKFLQQSKNANRNLQLELEKGKKDLPLEFLMKYQLQTYCYEQGSNRIVKVMRKCITMTQRLYLAHWAKFTEWKRTEVQREACKRIQRVTRGFLCRLKRALSTRRNVKRKHQRIIERHLMERMERIENGALTVQLAWRRYYAWKVLKRLKADLRAVVRVQNHFRGRRCKVALLVLQKIKAYRIHSATVIQSAFRGMKGRHAASLVRLEAMHRKQELLLNDVEYLRTQRFLHTGASVVIQKAYRARKFRHNFRFIGHDAAKQIQRIIRGFLGRIKAKKQREIGAFARWVYFNRGPCEAAASKIQNIYRGKIGRRLLEQMKHERDEAKRARMQKKATILTQKRKKGRVTQFLITKSKKNRAANVIQRFWRGKFAKRLIIHHRRKVKKERNFKAATKIQSTFRMHVCRKEYMTHVRLKAATKIQALYRGHAVRSLSEQRKDRETAAICIQCFARLTRAKAERKKRQLKFDSQAKIATFIRCYQGRQAYLRNLDHLRFLAETNEAGKAEMNLALRHEQDKLLLLALHIDPGSTNPANSEPLALFQHLCGGSMGSPKPSSSPTRRKEETTVGSAAFSRHCRDVGLLVTKKKASPKGGGKSTGPTLLESTEVDIIFAKCCMGKRRMDYFGFVDAIELIALHVYPELKRFRRMKDVDAQIVCLLENYFLKGKWAKLLHKRTKQRADNQAKKPQGMYRCWKSRQRARMAKIARDYQKQIQAQTTGAETIQHAWRAYIARKKLFETIRSTYRCFIDVESGAKFWQNPVTGTTNWTKPRILRDYDVDAVVQIPPQRHHLLEYCARCEEACISAYCENCEESHCKACSEKIHKKGSRAKHKLTPITRCTNCQFQLASRSCLECGGVQFCDCCAEHTHKGGAKLRHKLSWIVSEEHDICQECQSKMARYDYPHPVCSYCLETNYHIDPSTIYPRPFISKTMRERFELVQIERVKQFMLEQAQEKENQRKRKEQENRIIKVQALTRGVLLRKSAIGIQVKDQLQARKDALLEAESKKWVNRIKTNVGQIKQLAETSRSTLLAPSIGEGPEKRFTTLLKNKMQTIAKVNKEPGKSDDSKNAKRLLGRLSTKVASMRVFDKKTEESKSISTSLPVLEERVIEEDEEENEREKSSSPPDEPEKTNESNTPSTGSDVVQQQAEANEAVMQQNNVETVAQQEVVEARAVQEEIGEPAPAEPKEEIVTVHEEAYIEQQQEIPQRIVEPDEQVILHETTTHHDQQMEAYPIETFNMEPTVEHNAEQTAYPEPIEVPEEDPQEQYYAGEEYTQEEYEYFNQEEGYEAYDDGRDEWLEYLDEESGLPYWYNPSRHESTWYNPHEHVSPMAEHGDESTWYYEEVAGHTDLDQSEYAPVLGDESAQLYGVHYEGGEELEDGWARYVDDESGAAYLYNVNTGESKWCEQ